MAGDALSGAERRLLKLGPYAVTFEAPLSVALNAVDAWRLILFGIPRAAGLTSSGIAEGVLRRNAGAVLYAGEGHFRFMWVSDFGKSLRGAWDVLGDEYLSGQIDFMTRESARLGHVTSCFTRFHGFDMPWPRGDSLPWLIFAHGERRRRTGVSPDAVNRAILQNLFDEYETTHFADGLISMEITGDWADTVRRPSSTYNNLCALMALHEAPSLGLKTRHDPEEFSRRLRTDRWRGDHFRDHAATEALSVDSAVLALYLGLFDRSILSAAADRVLAERLEHPWPIRCAAVPHDGATVPLLTRLVAGYHRAAWLHLGAMWLNGLRGLGRDVSDGRGRIEGLIERHGQVLEAVNDDGSPYRSFVLGCERGLTMAAGQYLELIGPVPSSVRP
ncbi:MAG: hypothetical protein KGL74_04580 [Elusimicrobia bacterium]|nr:hypothetical protein [Elusimicrobiota bacterium]